VCAARPKWERRVARRPDTNDGPRRRNLTLPGPASGAARRPRGIILVNQNRSLSGWRLAPAAAVLILLVCPGAAAQEEDAETVRIASRLVTLDVLVTDSRTGARVDELGRGDFEVLDEGRPQALTHFGRGAPADRPLAVVLLVDTSTSLHQAKLVRLREGIERAVRQLRAEDLIAVMTYSPGRALEQGLTRDRGAVLDALARVAERQVPTGRRINHTGTEMAAAFLDAVRHAREQEPRARPALVVISDDRNDTPKKVAAETIEELLKGGAVVSGLLKLRGKLTLGGVLSADKELGHFSEQTGGEVVKVRGDDYSGALEQVIGNLAGRYSLAFLPERGRLDGRFHKLSVRVRVPPALGKGRRVEVRARRGYFAPAEPE